MALGYGADTWCGDRLVTGRMSRGVNVVILALYRRLITPRGTLRGGPEESAYGLDLAEYIGAVGYVTALAALPGLVRGELMKDDRVADIAVRTTISQSPAGLIAISLDVSGVLVDSEEDFAFTVSASEVSVELIGFAVAA